MEITRGAALPVRLDVVETVPEHGRNQTSKQQKGSAPDLVLDGGLLDIARLLAFRRAMHRIGLQRSKITVREQLATDPNWFNNRSGSFPMASVRSACVENLLWYVTREEDSVGDHVARRPFA